VDSLLGTGDATAAVFGYYDFLKTKIVIQGKLLFHGKDSKVIAEACKAKENV